MASIPPPPNNLPLVLGAFIGREIEVSQVRQALAASRLLTLTGPAGAGKTRLALQVASLARPDFPDGIWWCDLSTLTDPAYLAAAVGGPLRTPQSAGQPALESLISALSGRHSLILLDNCEHLLAASAALSLAILQACANVRLLTTSLLPLGLPAEQVWPVPPLSLVVPPQAASPSSEPDAIRFFVDRASRALPSFRLTSENRPAVLSICRQLDGLPLALEFAAARLRLLSLEQVAQRLADAVGLLTRGSLSPMPRHQTLRLAIEWSWRFLSEPEQRLLLRLSVFAGPFTVSMAEAVCAGPDETSGVLDQLESLADKSFLVLLPRSEAGGISFRLLEVIRQYARENLETSGEAPSVRDRYLGWCLAWAEAAAATLAGPGRAAWLAQFDWGQDHFRAALRWACTSRQAAAGLRLAVALGRYWMTGGFAEGRAWLEELLALVPVQPIPGLVRAWALLYSGRLAARQGDSAHGRLRGEESLALFRAAGDPAGLLAALNLLALVAQDAHDYSRADACYAEGLALSRQSGEIRMTAVLLINQGLLYYDQQAFLLAAPLWSEAYELIDRLADDSIASRDNLACLAMMQGDLPRAQGLLEVELQRLGESGDPFALAILQMDLGEVFRRQGVFERAGPLLHEALDRHRRLADTYHLGETLANLGSLARNQGSLAAASQYYEQSLAALQPVRYTRLASQVNVYQGLLAVVEGQPEAALSHFRAGLRLALAGQHQLSHIEALEGFAGLWAAQGDAARAGRWLSALTAARAALGAPIPPVESARYDQLEQDLLKALGLNRLAALRAEAAPPLDDLDREALGPAELPSGAAAPDTVRVFALGATLVFLGGRALQASDWTYAKSKELLFYLLTRGPASKAQIGLDLWPEASPAQLRASFHSALHHLRRALGSSPSVMFTDGVYALNPSFTLGSDIHAFRSHLGEARSALAAGASSVAIPHLEAAVSLWRGDYLADMESAEWAVFNREALRQDFFDCLLQLADQYFAAARYPAAASAYQRALQLDNYLERAHRGLMRCLARQGEAGRAAQHYRALRQILHQELSTTPASETTFLYDRIRRGDDV